MRTVLLAAAAVLLVLSTACSPTLNPDGAEYELTPNIEDSTADDDGPNDDVDEEPPQSPIDDEPETEPETEPEPLDCGPNSAEVDAACVCDDLYTMCDAAEESIGCCAYGIEAFEVTVVAATILPYADIDDETPWDWSGFVPSWMQELIGQVIVYVDEDAAGWVDVLDYVYQYAPALLSGSTPPDPYVSIELNDTPMYETLVKDNDLEPIWYETETFTVQPSAELTLWYRDSDIDFDDDIDGIYFTQADLQWYAGLGEVTFEGATGAYDLTLKIEPVQ